MKIYSEEVNKEGFDDIPMKELNKMVGWVEPPTTENGTWDVTTSDEGGFECSTQEIAHIMASVEEIKAMMINASNAKEANK